jgi:hypothetical protein
MVNALLLRDLPVREPARVVAFVRGNSSTFCYPDYRDFRDQSRDVFDGVTAHFPFVPANLNAGGSPQRIWGQLVSGNYSRCSESSHRWGGAFCRGMTKREAKLRSLCSDTACGSASDAIPPWWVKRSC